MKPEITVKENYEFRRIYRKGKSVVAPSMVLYCQKNRQGRTRRRFREIWRLNKKDMEPGWDIILVARVRAVDSSYQKLDKTYRRLLREAGLLKEEN